MDLPQDLRYLLIQWLEDEIDVLSKFSSKLAMQYGKALENLRKYPMPVKYTKDLLGIQFIGPKIVAKLDKKLELYCQQNGLNMPAVAEVPITKRSIVDDDDSDNNNGKTKRKRKATEKRYIPLKRSGGYAIILALLMNDPRRSGMTKDEIIRHLTPLCDQSFHANPSTNQFYSAWSSSKTLTNKQLIEFKGRPAHYYLTDQGEELATLLLQNEKMELPLKVDPTASKFSIDHHNHNLQTYLRHRYSHWNTGSYDIELLIDNREIRSMSQRDYFSTKLNELGVSCSTLALTVGDGLWVAKNRENGTRCVLNFIFERKRLDDLASSIKDGRYMEQKTRLKRTGINNVYYIVEETMGSDVSMMGDAIQTSILLNITNSQFYIKRTKDSDDTILFLQKLTNKIENYYKGRDLIVIEKLEIKTQLDYSLVLQQFRDKFDSSITKLESVYTFDNFQDILSKSDLVTVKEMFIKLLMTIKGVSLDKLIMIQRKFPTPKSLISAYENCTTVREKEDLMQVNFSNEVGNKKIGPLLSRKVYQIWGDI